jgi:hypothetical protein
MDQRSEPERQPSLTEPEVSQALIVDVRGAFDAGWHASRRAEDLAHLPSEQAAATAVMNKLLAVLSGSQLDGVYRRVLFAWDGGFHKTVKPRLPKPEDFKADLAYFQGLLQQLLGGTHYIATTCEADDAVATAAWTEARGGRHCCVVSGDKDLQQLACRDITYYCFNRKSILPVRYILDKWDLKHPAQLAVRLAVVGDPQDGIPGVAKWGDKKWSDKIMKTFAGQSLPELVEHVATVIPAEQVEPFYQSLDATLLNDQVEGVPEPTELVLQPLEFLDELGLDGTIRSRYARFIGEWRVLGDTPANVTSDADREY